MKKHITEYAVIPEHILTFKICAVCIFMVYDNEVVFALNEKFVKLEFGSFVTSLAVADIF